METIDICTTAVIRPEILEGTFESFSKCLFSDKNQYRLFINIDPIGDKKKIDKMIKVCNKYFGDIVHYQFTIKPSFPKAVLWLWKTACDESNSKYIFHLEDDWVIYRNTDINHMINILENNKDLACLRLYKEDIPKSTTPRMFNKIYDYKPHGFFVSRDSSDQFGLNPVLIKKEFIKEALPLLKDDLNPEKQMRAAHPWMHDFIMKWNYGIYGEPGDKRLVWGKRGKYWREDQGFEKGKSGFITWVKKGENK